MEAFCSHIRSDKWCARASSVGAQHGWLCVSVSLIAQSFFLLPPALFFSQSFVRLLCAADHN